MKLSVFTTLTSLLSAAGLANAGYVFSTGVTDTFTATPGSPATVPIYLVEDSSSTGSLEAAGGLYSNAFTVSRSVGTAPLSTLAATSDFAAYDGYPYYTGDSAASMLAEVGWDPEADPHAFVCGPTGFVEAVASALVESGHPPARVKTERFGPTGG